ncbi:MAG: DNA photolyase [Alphaproteobacteria bacterium HGW-Alphaproteobacteria-18]|nr:MAG: DNA photolyase [Alphaproteobacteria bacterium HGW-Alphaproteobacteria-18]
MSPPSGAATPGRPSQPPGLSPQAPSISGWLPDRRAALDRLEDFIPYAGRPYALSRNFDLGPQQRSNISGLSPWLRHRVILEEEVLAAVLHQHAPDTAEAFIREVFWRGYFKGWLEHNPAVWHRYRQSVSQQLTRLDSQPGLNSRYEAAVSGKSGIACFDAWASELIATGYLHNHARMWFASIWIFTLQLPWELGADFFLRHLLDGDAASNTCSWRWVGGLHTRGKTYLARAGNIDQYTLGRYPLPAGLADVALPIEEAPLAAARKPVLPGALPPGERYGLLITEEDLFTETLPLPQPPEVIFYLPVPARRSPVAASAPVTEFVSSLIAEAAGRAGHHFSTEAISLPPDDWQAALAENALRRGIKQIATAYLPAGPARDLVTAHWPDTLALHEVVRPYDRAVWPHASAGFFRLKKAIPALLQGLMPTD